MITRLGLYGGPRGLYGDFSGKVEQETWERQPREVTDWTDQPRDVGVWVDQPRQT